MKKFSAWLAGFYNLLETATSPFLLEPDWSAVGHICDLIRQEKVEAKHALSEIKKRLYTENPHVTLYALEVLNSCVKDCGAPFHAEIATESFMEVLYELVKTTKLIKVKEKVLELVQTWAHAFRQMPRYIAVQNFVKRMTIEGYMFPALKESDAMLDSVPERIEGDRRHRHVDYYDKLNKTLVKEQSMSCSSSAESSAFQSESSMSYLNRVETIRSHTVYYKLGEEAKKINENVVEDEITRKTKLYKPEISIPRVQEQKQNMIWQHQQYSMMYGVQQPALTYPPTLSQYDQIQYQQPYNIAAIAGAWPNMPPNMFLLPPTQYGQIQPPNIPVIATPGHGPSQVYPLTSIVTSGHQQPYMTAMVGDLQNMRLTHTYQPIPQNVAQSPSGYSAAFDVSRIPERKGNIDVHSAFDAAATPMSFKLADAHAPIISNTNIDSKVTSSIRGISLLINNYSFTKNKKVRDFPLNSAESSAKLYDVLSKIGYDVTSCTNLSAAGMEEKIQEIRGSVMDKHDSVIIGISSHGNETPEGQQVTYGTDCEPVNITDTIFKFTSTECPQLRGKVKIFLIDACRGANDCEDISAKKIFDQLIKRNASIACKSGECAENIIIINATQKGFYSYVGMNDPVLLFSCFADCLSIPDYRCMKLGEFFKAVKKAVKKAAIKQIGKKMKPEMRSDLDDNLEFSFGSPKKLTLEEKSSAITEASLRIVFSFEKVNKSAIKMKLLRRKFAEENQASVPLPNGYIEAQSQITKVAFPVGNSWFDPMKIENISPDLIAYSRVKQTKNSYDLSSENAFYELNLEIHYNITPENAINKLYESGLLLESKRVIFIVHGFKNDRNTYWLTNMKNELLKCEDQTVIIVAWGGGADLPLIEYSKAALNIKPVGNWLADYAKEINKCFPKMEIWGIGYSLGAHLLGVAGRYSKAFTRITGLDPAGPTFEDGDNQNMRLREGDAQIVDVIHTDGHDNCVSLFRGDENDELKHKDIMLNHCGTLIPLGTADFYPNYGMKQPGCNDNKSNHMRAIELFIWSISNPGKFKTNLVLDGSPYLDEPVNKHKEVPDLTAEMGYHYETGTSDSSQEQRNYYLTTNAEEPWI